MNAASIDDRWPDGVPCRRPGCRWLGRTPAGLTSHLLEDHAAPALQRARETLRGGG